MSAEESGCDDDGTILVRSLPWRSSRVCAFFRVLDAGEDAAQSLRMKRGSGKLFRRAGPPVEGVVLPPQGVMDWMVNDEWLGELRLRHPVIASSLTNLARLSPEFDWTNFEEV